MRRHTWNRIIPKIGPHGDYFHINLICNVDTHGRYSTKIEVYNSFVDKGWATMYRFSGGLPGDQVTSVWQCVTCKSVVFAIAEESMSRARRHCDIPLDCDLALVKNVIIC